MTSKIDQLRYRLTEGRIGRREFLEGAAALGLTAAAAQSLMIGGARAAEPKKGGLLRAGLAEGATTDSLDPQTYTDMYMISVGFATHNTLTEISPEGALVGDAAEGWEASADAKTCGPSSCATASSSPTASP